MTLRPIRVAAVVEVALVAILSLSWLVAYLVARASLEEIPAGTRLYILAIYETDGRLVGGLVLGLVGVGILTARRWFPTPALFGVSAVVFAAEWWYPYVTRVQFASPIMVLVAVFWALWRTDRFALLSVVSLLLGAAITVPRYEVNRNLNTARLEGTSARLAELTSIVATLEAMILVTMAIVAAMLVRRFDAQAAELAERNRELTEQRAASARAAVLDERVRIARELHDVVAHHVATMTVHAGAARQVVAARPEAAAESLHQIESAGRNAVLELQRLLGFLRGGDDSTEVDPGTADAVRAPTPSLRALDRLGTSFGDRLRCELTVVGDLRAVPPSVDVSAYRIVQEALTNVIKHSTATGAEVVVDADGDRVSLQVLDRGWPVANGQRSTGGGLGLVGMRERASLHGGTIEVGPRPDGGWLVEATLPYDGSSR